MCEAILRERDLFLLTAVAEAVSLSPPSRDDGQSQPHHFRAQQRCKLEKYHLSQ